MTAADPAKLAHDRRLQQLRAWLSGLTDRKLRDQHDLFALALESEQDRYPDAWCHPCKHWRTPEERTAWYGTRPGLAWLHSVYALQRPLATVCVEARLELQRRANARTDGSVLAAARRGSLLG